MMRRLRWHRHLLPSTLFAAVVVLVLVALTAARVSNIHAQSRARPVPAAPTSQGPCTTSVCTFQLGVNPALLSGNFACPAIQNAQAQITITNRFANGAQNDIMTLTATGLPRNTGFDMFLVENSPLDSGTFSGFGFGWYQSDVESSATGTVLGNHAIRVQGIFDKETFIENPSSPFTPIHTFNVGFWFNSPIEEQQVCGNATTPATTPFNGEQDAGLLAMITQGEPLQFVQ